LQSHAIFFSSAAAEEMKVLLEDIERERAKTAAAENRISEVDKERRETAAKVSDLEAKISKLTRDTTKMKHDHEKQLKDVNDRVLNAVRLLGFKGDRLPGWRNIFRFFFNLFKFHFKANELAGHGSDDDDLDFDGGGKKYAHFILNVVFGFWLIVFSQGNLLLRKVLLGKVLLAKRVLEGNRNSILTVTVTLAINPFTIKRKMFIFVQHVLLFILSGH